MIRSVGQELECTQELSTEMVNAVLDCIKGSLENGEDVLISGFGKFCVKDKAARKGRNPATGEAMIIVARKIVTFKCSGTLREKLNPKD